MSNKPIHKPTYKERCQLAENMRSIAQTGTTLPLDVLVNAAITNGSPTPTTSQALLLVLADFIDPQIEPDHVWESWVESLAKGDAVDRFAYDCIVHGGDMGPNGNVYEGIDEGRVLTDSLFSKFVSDFKAELASHGG